MEYRKIPAEAMKKLPEPMNLIRVVPTVYDYLDSDLKKDGFGIRQHLELKGGFEAGHLQNAGHQMSFV